MTICLVLPTTKAFTLATNGKLLKKILRLPTLFALPPTKCSPIQTGVEQPVLRVCVLEIAHPGVRNLQLINLNVKPFARLLTGATLPNTLPTLALRNYPQELARTLTRPGSLNILSTCEQSSWACRPLNPLPRFNNPPIFIQTQIPSDNISPRRTPVISAMPPPYT